MEDYAKAAEQQMKQLNNLVTKNMADLTEAMLPQKTAVISIAEQDGVVMNLTGKAAITITLVFKSKEAAEITFNILAQYGTQNNKANLLRRIYKSIRWW